MLAVHEYTLSLRHLLHFLFLYEHMLAFFVSSATAFPWGDPELL